MCAAPDETVASVRIRMYGQGLGDCFLLTFPRSGTEGERQVHVVIDCGVVAGTPDDTLRLQKVVGDIAAATDNHVDLLVLTHEHWDHLSGFLKAQDQWRDIRVDRLWLGWTEKDDPEGLPGVLQRILEKHRMTLAAVADRSMRLGLNAQTQAISGLMGFLSDAPAPGGSFAAAPTVGDALAAALEKVPAEGDRDYLEPGEVRYVPGTDVKCYTLGPPRSDARLRQTDPGRNHETYEFSTNTSGNENAGGDGLGAWDLMDLDETDALSAMGRSHSQFNAFAMSLLGPVLAGMERTVAAELRMDANDQFRVDAELETYERTFPFDRMYRVPLAEADRAAREYSDTYPALASYIQEMNHWRRIDLDWLGPAEQLALQVDHLTNNTSLVLALELPADRPEDRKILLFVGDAQVGNWLSWGDIQAWAGVDGAEPGSKRVDINEMLGRIAFYKVGHHGSHNATLKRAVEMMPDDGSLVAFAPVSIPVAHEIKRWTKMPRESLVEALSTRSEKGVLFPDGDIGPGLRGAGRKRKEEQIQYEVSDEMLPPKMKRLKQGPDKPSRAEIEGEVPLWVQVTIQY
jgi:hypothetical protein